MNAAKVVIEAPVLSFRYPHFLVGRQLTYRMPPPSTIYGHICSCAGELLPPESILFAYEFKFRSMGSDYEHQQILSRNVGKKSSSYELKLNPTSRDYLFDCRLTLYLIPDTIGDYFKEPVFCLNLGRSQDLARIVSVLKIPIEKSDGVYFKNTLLPFSMREKTFHGITVNMPRYISPPPERVPSFGRYLELHEMIYAGKRARESKKINPNRLVLEENDRLWLCDPSETYDDRLDKGLIFHTLKGDENEDTSGRIMGQIGNIR